MTSSFQRRLVLHLGVAVVGLGLLAAAAQFVLAWRELRESQDDMLRQVATLALLHPGHEMSTPGRGGIDDHDSLIHVAMLPIDPPPAWLGPVMTSGLRTLDTRAGRMRVFVQRQGPYTAVVAQATDARDELAWNGALRALLPSLLLAPLLIWLIGRGVRREFEPVVQAARRLEALETLQEPSVELRGMPAEIQPFVDAIEGLLGRTRELMRQQQRFVADAAHELRSPLTALALQARNLRHAKSLDEARLRLVPLEQGIERARRLSEQLLDLARIESGDAPSESVDLAALGRELLAMHFPIAEQRGIDLGMEAGHVPSVRSSARLLRTILGNAIDNALKYTPAGGEVTLRIAALGDGARCEIIDSGPGLEPSEREEAFKPFHRMAGQEVEGTGLGLAIAREAAWRIGARISLHERDDQRKGLAVRVDLPGGHAIGADEP
ncbi:HAMP domain-containing sensor histidine kinase [Thiomonas sp. FB-6]|uniref:sensor histidine kinase n=1 Tax=Thiomonas sp. FB-6 TaxID=1158291 RepID=UPI0003601E42|nr:ATP-binding protein [Thiomonas sp. FB-6]